MGLVASHIVTGLENLPQNPVALIDSPRTPGILAEENGMHRK